MAFLLDPKFFNYLIMSLYVVNAMRWGFNQSWADMGYWACAFGITACVTWGYERS